MDGWILIALVAAAGLYAAAKHDVLNAIWLGGVAMLVVTGAAGFLLAL
jgi:hypothetical protein